jgi:monothiol glutaredoxin
MLRPDLERLPALRGSVPNPAVWHQPRHPLQIDFQEASMDVMDRIRQQVEENPVVIFMKGTPQFPMCGFSSRASEALKRCDREFAYVNVLGDPEVFQNLPRFADWPTFPQIYIDGELVGGCDITLELLESGELKKMVEEAHAKRAG